MKKIVNGRLYDTGEATDVLSWRQAECVHGVRVDVNFTLYRRKVTVATPSEVVESLKLNSWGGVDASDVPVDKSRGEFFLAVQVGGWSGPGRIEPLTDDRAKALFEEYTDSDYGVADRWAELFGTNPCVDVLASAKEAFSAGAEARKKQYEEAEAKKKAEAGTC